MRLIGRSEVVASVDLALNKNIMTIGAASDNNIVVNDNTVDNRHVRINLHGHQWFVTDLNSRTGTYLNGIRIYGSQPIWPGDILQCGSAIFNLAAESGDKLPLSGSRPERRRLWLWGAFFILLCLSASVFYLTNQSQPLERLAWVLPAAPETITPTATVIIVQATFTPTVTNTAAPKATVTQTATMTITSTPVAPTATVPAYKVTMLAVLKDAPPDRASAAMTAIAAMPLATRQAAVSTVAAGSHEEISAWLDSFVGTPTPLPPGGRIVYAKLNQDGSYDIYLQNLNTNAESFMQADGNQPALRADGELIAYRSNSTSTPGLFIGPSGGSQRWRLTRDTHPSDINPAWSANGDYIAFSSLRFGDGRSRIYLVPAEGGIATGISYGEYPSWSPNGNNLAFKGCVGGSCGIMLSASDGSSQRLLSDDATDGAPVWSPDGQYIAFHSTRAGNWDIYVMRSDGSDIRSLTNDASSETVPCWSPDGKYIAFRSNRNDEWAVWAVPFGGGEAIRLFAAPLQAGDEISETIDWLP